MRGVHCLLPGSSSFGAPRGASPRNTIHYLSAPSITHSDFGVVGEQTMELQKSRRALDASPPPAKPRGPSQSRSVDSAARMGRHQRNTMG